MNEVFALLGCYAEGVGGWLPTFQEELSFPLSRVKKSSTVEDGHTCTETSVNKYQLRCAT